MVRLFYLQSTDERIDVVCDGFVQNRVPDKKRGLCQK